MLKHVYNTKMSAPNIKILLDAMIEFVTEEKLKHIAHMRERSEELCQSKCPYKEEINKDRTCEDVKCPFIYIRMLYLDAFRTLSHS